MKREPTLDTIVLSQQAGSAFSEIVISKTLSKNIGEKSSELLNRQTSIVISYQQKKTTTADFTKPESCHNNVIITRYTAGFGAI